MKKMYYRVELWVFESTSDLFIGNREGAILRGIGYIIFNTNSMEIEGYVGNEAVYIALDDDILCLELLGEDYNVFSVKLEKDFDLSQELLLESDYYKNEVCLLCFKERIQENIIQNQIEKDFEQIKFINEYP